MAGEAESALTNHHEQNALHRGSWLDALRFAALFACDDATLAERSMN